jgi:predicted ribosomally synthesized peptide with SipW-like signal peptide
MRHHDHTISRRKLLGTLGTVGGAAALGGAGTMAFFSDEEEFTNNELVAGELDLMVDWEEHYSDWSSDENDDRTDSFLLNPYLESTEDESDTDPDDDAADDFEVLMTDGDPAKVPDGYTGFPVPMEPLIAVPDQFVDDFMASTAVEAFPDTDDDGIQDLILTRNQLSRQYGLTGEQLEEAFRSQFANLDAGLSSDARTNATVGGPPNPQTTRPGDPLLDISDVKPGDFGEVTFSIHVFNNPAYIWLVGGLRANEENGYTDPERADGDGDRSGPNGRGELLDAIETAVWHDNGDNVLGDDGGGVSENLDSPHDVANRSSIAVSQSEAIVFQGSLRELLSELSNGGIPLDADPRSESSGRDCFPYSTTRYFAMAWWLPVDHANEIQTDRAAFDLGFYTEQCRHNDGSGLSRTDDASSTPSTVSISTTSTRPDVSTTHRVAVDVGDDLPGDRLTELTVDYPEGFDVSGVGPGDANLTYSSPDGGFAQVVRNPSATTVSDGNTRLTMAFNDSVAFDKLESFAVTYTDVQNASSPGEYETDVFVNEMTMGAPNLTIS